MAVPTTRAVAAKAAPAKAAVAAQRVAAAVVTSVAATALVPQVAEAATTPSLDNLIGSVFAGAFVLAAIGGAVIGVARFDQIRD